MSAELKNSPLDDALHTAADDVGGRIDFIKTLVQSRVWLITDRPWDGHAAPDKGMQLALVSDGSNQQQAMLAVFTGRGYAAEYIRSIEHLQHAFHNIVEVDMTWALLGVPPGAGVMVNPNAARGFRISPEVASELRQSAQLNFSLAQHDLKQPRPAKPVARSAVPLSAISAAITAIKEFIQAGDVESAERRLDGFIKSGADEEYVLSMQALIAKSRTDYPLAITLLEKALQKTADQRLSGEFWWFLAQVHEEAKQLEQAEHAYFQAYACDPSNVGYVMDLSHFLAKQYRLDEAVALLKQAVSAHPSDPAPGVLIGILLIEGGRQEEAITAFDDVLVRHPHSAGAHFNRAVGLQMLGRMDEARTAYEQALRLDPALDGYNQYANLRDFKSADPAQIDSYVQMLEHRVRDDMPLSSRIDGNFALARIYQVRDDLDRSFAYVEKANRLKRSTIKYATADTQQDVENIIGLFNKPFIERFKGLAASELAPIFVLGMPRSGTTLTEQILAAHSRVTAGGEMIYLAELGDAFAKTWAGVTGETGDQRTGLVEALHQVTSKLTERTKRLQTPGKRFTDKMPGNYLHIGLIYLLFPNASVIHCRRNPIDTCLSIYERLFTKGLLFSYDTQELGQYYNLYLRMMRHWRATLPEDFILDVQYEEMVAEPEQQIRRLLAFCNLEFEEACLEFHKVKRSVTTASTLQVRQPMYRTSVNRWEKYGDRLKPLIEALGPGITGKT
ncbi:MAG: sulfotransferase [Gammaproteobacteria bacterium]|nr:sulfotransferase [Gammaproteobacteria bacterium]